MSSNSSNENTSVPIIEASAAATTPSSRTPNDIMTDEIISNSFHTFLANTDNLETDSATAVAAAAAATSLGYCHVCNRQIRINLESFTCTQCNGGFIELFDINESNNNDNLSLLNDSDLLTNTNNTNRFNSDRIQSSRSFSVSI